MNEIFVDVPNYENYEFSNMNRLRSKKTGNFMKLNNDKRFYMYPNGKRRSILLSTLRKLFQIDKDEMFVSIYNDSYEISNKGRIFDNDNMQYLVPLLENDEYYVNLKVNGLKKSFSIKELIKKFC